MSKAPARRKHRLLFVLLLLVVLAIAGRVFLLPGMGTFLVKSDPPAKAQAAVVLAGDQWGNRVLRGAQLKRDGFVDKVLVSGGPGVYGFYESELAIQFAVKKGYPPEYFEALRDEVHSTQEEAWSIAQELKKRGIRSALIVTSDFHTMRSSRIWRYTAPWLNLRIVESQDRYFRRHTWWQDREASKLVFIEWVKFMNYVTDFFPPEKSGPVPPP